MVPSVRAQQRICATRARYGPTWFRNIVVVVAVMSYSKDQVSIVVPVVSFAPIYSFPIVQNIHDLFQYQCKLIVWSNKDDSDGDIAKAFATPKKPKKGTSTLKKKNKPRSKAKNLFNNGGSNISNRNIDPDIYVSKTSRRSNVNTLPPPLLVNDDVNGISNDNEQYRRLYEDNSIENDCIHFTTCSGCTIGRTIADTNVIRAAQRYFAMERYDGGTTKTTSSASLNDSSSNNKNNNKLSSYPLVVPTPMTQWRTQAKLAVANKSKSAWSNTGCIFGLYEKGSHVVSPIPQCIVHHPSINQAIQLLEAATARTGMVAYSENGRDGDLRYVQLQVERITGHVCLTLVYNAASLKECQPSLSRLVKELTVKAQRSDNHNDTSQTSIWHSIWCHCNDSTRNNIFSRSPGRWHRLVGPEFMREPIPVEATLTSTSAITSTTSNTASTAIAAGWLYFSPLTFRQGNLDGFDILALNVARAVPSGAKVCELYGGVGVLGLTALSYHYYHQKSRCNGYDAVTKTRPTYDASIGPWKRSPWI